MKKAFLLAFFFISASSFSQSKKEQIELLNKRVDSLNQVVNAQIITISDKNAQISGLNAKVTNLESTITFLNAELSKLNTELQGNKNENATKSKEISQLQAQLKTKTDSLTLVHSELKKLKPAPKTTVTTTTNQVTQTGPNKSVKIGTQVWMTKNLDVSVFRNGDTIPEAKTNIEWIKAGDNQQPAWCYYDNDPANGAKYGKLYNWYAVNDSRGLAPTGWHVPSDAEWTQLKDFLGGIEVAGTKMKSKPIYVTKIRYVEEGGYDDTKWVPCKNCSYWSEKQKANNPCTVCRNQRGKIIKTGKYIPKTKRKVEDKINIGFDGTNESSFSGLPGGSRSYPGTFVDIGEDGYWWSSTEYGRGSAWERDLNEYNDGLSSRSHTTKEYGFSVRCLRD